MCPRSSLIRFVVHDNASTGRCHGAEIEVVVSKEVSVGVKLGIDSVLEEEVQGDGCLIEKLVPFTDRKIGIGCREASNKVIIESLNRSLCRITTVHVGWCQLETDLVFDHDIFHVAGCLIFRDV